MFWQLLLLPALVAAIPFQGLSIRDDSEHDNNPACELNGNDPSGGDAGDTPACHDCKTVNGIPAPQSTPDVSPTGVINVETLDKRAAEAVPLMGTDDVEEVDGQPSQVSLFDYLLSQAQDNTDNDIDITPTDDQLDSWEIDGTPIGATGKWYEFGNTPQFWKMRGLSGCTGIIIMSSKGFWAGHLWESTGEDKINGGSSFKKRLSKDDVVVRSVDEFKKIAVDIMTQATPADQVSKREHWISLKDLENNKGNPFGDADDVNVFIFTRAQSGTNKAIRYNDMINALSRGLKSALDIPRGNYGYITYPGAGDTGKLKYPGANGKIAVQYTPFDGEDSGDGCKKIAGAQVWANPESQKKPAILKRWVALDNQQVAKRDTCNAAPTTEKPTATPSCTMQKEDPDQGINTEYCVCESSRTLPLLTLDSTVVMTKSCEYTSLPPTDAKRDALPTITSAPVTAREPLITPGPSLDDRDLTITTGFGPPTTDLKNCQVCKQVVVNEDSCTSIKDCTKQTAAITLEAGTSYAHVGTVTGDALYTQVSSALDKICPTATSGSATACETGSVDIGGVPYVGAGFLNKDGKLAVSVESSKYNDTRIRDGLIRTIAAAAKNAATDKNCYEAEYDVEILKRSEGPWWLPSVLRRDHPFPMQEKATWCNTVGFAGPQYYNPYWRQQEEPGATDYIDAHMEFHEASGGDFDCKILEGLVDAFAVALDPLMAVGDLEVGQAIEIACECGSGSCLGEKRDLDNSTLIGMD